jgi:ion channel-forming bestrophin family protein
MFAKWFYKIWPPLPVWKGLDAAVVVVIVYSALVEYIAENFGLKLPKWMGDLTVVNGILLGVLLGFRNSQAYDRWWEARKLWGQLINDSRNFCLKIQTLPGIATAERQLVGRHIIGFAVALKNHLRGGRPLATVPGFEKATENPTHVPLKICEWIYTQLRAWRSSNKITEMDLLLLDPHAKALMDVSGACERIRSSPVPQSYRALLRHGTILYLLTAPWFMANDYGYYGIVIVALLAYFLLGIELTAEDVEEPFGKDGDDLELNRYCETIRVSAEQVLGDLGIGDVGKSTGSVPQLTK